LTKAKKIKQKKISITSVAKSVVNRVFPNVDEKLITAIIALMFTGVILAITTIFGIKYAISGDMQDVDAIKTLWAVLGTLYGLVLGYYFKE
jgi:hypothetical protein